MYSDENLENSKRRIAEASNQLAEKQHVWFQHILLVSSSLFGILIALHNNNSYTLYIRLCFAIAVALLALGILLTAILQYSHLEAVHRARKALVQESQIAFREHRAATDVYVPERKIFVICEKASYVCFVLSVLLLAVYTFLTALFSFS